MIPAGLFHWLINYGKLMILKALQKSALALSVSAAVLTLPGVANADGTGLMLGGGGYYTQIDDKFDANDIDWNDPDDIEVFFDDKSAGYNVAIGWRFYKWLAIDAGYWDLGEFKSDRLENDRAKIETTAVTAGGMVSVPLWLIDIYARGGAAFWDADSRNYDEDGTDPYYGLGASFNIGGSLDLYLEWVRFALDTDIDTVGLGARFTF